VYVQGISNGELDARVKAAIREVFTGNVSVYTNLQGVQPVAVFVTGYVEKPGRYAGSPNDSLLYFLDQASGIDKNTGSFRRIRVLRSGKTIAEADLYDFLINGQLPRPQFEDGDTIVVEPRGPVVTVAGDVARPYRYELDRESRLGHELLELTQINPGVSHVLQRGVRETGPFSAYLPLRAFRSDVLRAGDEVYFSADQRADSIVVQVEGSYKGPSRFVVPKDATLKELLDSIAVDPAMTDVRSVSVRRESVAARQRQSLEDSLRRLETTYLGASSGTAEEARIRVQEAELIQDFVKRAREVNPNGRIVIARNGQISDIRLQDGDIITIPERSDSLLLSGEVLVPQAMAYVESEGVSDYIRRAGGFTDRADKRNVLVVRQNGEVVAANEAVLRPGDEILVLPAVPTKNLQLASTLAQILFHIAVTTRTVLDL
jgi:protein involved in polysaccharide export with SLBB domain